MASRGSGSVRTGRLDLADLVDLEVQLADDEQRPEAELVARDAGVAATIGNRPLSERGLVAAWIREVQPARATSAGHRVARAYRRASLLLSLAMFALGAIVAVSIFNFTGDHPINVLIVLGVFVLLQLLSLLVSLVAMTIATARPGFFEGLPLVLFVRQLAARLWRRASERRVDEGTRGAVNRLLSRRSLYSRVERQLIFRHVQVAAAWFNAGALIVLLVEVTVTDLAFGWSTTLQLGPERFHQLCERLSILWSRWFPEAIPSLDLVRATQYFRLEGAYVGATHGVRIADPSLSGQWWPFLVACLVAYGLLPRVLLAVWSGLMVSLSLSRVRLDTPDITRLLARLTAPALRRSHSNDPGNVTPLGAGLDPVGTALSSEPATAVGVLWRDAEIPQSGVAELARQRYRASLQSRLGAAGGHDFADDERFVASLEPADEPMVLIVSEPWTVPDAALKRFIGEVRARGTRRPIVVALAEGGTEEDTAIWAGYLAELRDPYLYFEREVRVCAEAAS
jgi:hypothetical protein